MLLDGLDYGFVTYIQEIWQYQMRYFNTRVGSSDNFSAFLKGSITPEAGFKQCHKICLRTIHGEAASVNEAVVSEGREKLQEVLAGYQLRDIYNLNETRLYFRLKPNKTLATVEPKTVNVCITLTYLLITFWFIVRL